MSDTMKRWKKNAKDTYKDIKDIDPEKATKQQFILYAACVALGGDEDSKDEVMPVMSESPSYSTPAIPQATMSYADIVRDEIESAERYADMGENDISEQELSHAHYFLSKLKAQAITSEDKALVRELWAHLNLARGRL